MAVDTLRIAAYGPGTWRPHELQAALEQSWCDLVANPEMRARAAALLGVAPEALAKSSDPPLRVSTPPAGMSAGEIAIVIVSWVGTEVLLGAVKDIAKEALKRLWKDMVLPTLRKRLPEPQALGQEKTLNDGDSDAGV